MVGPFLPPQGLPSSGGSVPAPTVAVATSESHSGRSTGTFTATGLPVAASAYYTLSPAVPSGATAILSVEWEFKEDNGWATPQGYVDGETSSAVAMLSNSSGSLATFTLAGDLALSTAGITVPATYSGVGYDVAVTYAT